MIGKDGYTISRFPGLIEIADPVAWFSEDTEFKIGRLISAVSGKSYLQ